MNWRQVHAIVWLRWRLSRNQFTRAGRLNAVLSTVLVGLLLLGAFVLTLAAAVGGFFAGEKAPPQLLLLIWDGVLLVFLVFWASGLMVEIQRSESIDLTKLMHLPVTLQQVFVFNYLASHATPSIVLLLPAMLALAAGLTASGGAAMALLTPLVLSFVFLITSWTYCLRGWLSALMSNKRRRRAIIVWITFAFVMLAQLPNLVFNSHVFREHVSHRTHAAHTPAGEFLPEKWLEAHLLFPPGWVGYGAMELKQNRFLPVFGAIFANSLLGVLGLMRAYRLTLRFYRGMDDAESLPAEAMPTAPRGQLLVERRLPWLPEEVSALTLATIRSLLRAPELKMAFIMPLVLPVVFLSLRMTHRPEALPRAWAGFLVTGVVSASAFSLVPTMSNVFGLDRNGFRALVLLPTRRDYILLAKNLAFFPLVAIVACVLLVVMKLFLPLPWRSFLPGFLQILIAFLLFSLAGNLLSILTPYRLSANTLQAKKPKPVVFLAVFVSLLCLPVVLSPVLIPAGLEFVCDTFELLPWLPVNALASLTLLAAVATLYWLLLPAQGRLLQRREMTILREVTEEVE